MAGGVTAGGVTAGDAGGAAAATRAAPPPGVRRRGAFSALGSGAGGVPGAATTRGCCCARLGAPPSSARIGTGADPGEVQPAQPRHGSGAIRRLRRAQLQNARGGAAGAAPGGAATGGGATAGLAWSATAGVLCWQGRAAAEAPPEPRSGLVTDDGDRHGRHRTWRGGGRGFATVPFGGVVDTGATIATPGFLRITPWTIARTRGGGQIERLLLAGRDALRKSGGLRAGLLGPPCHDWASLRRPGFAGRSW